MPRHDPSKTPPEKRRAPKGSMVARIPVELDAQSLSDLETLLARWKKNNSATVREALRRCVERGD